MISKSDYFIGEGAYQCTDAIANILNQLNDELDMLYGDDILYGGEINNG